MPQASLSPDDSQLVYSISKRTIKVVDLATGQVRVLGQEGAFPQWSPLGTEIAYASTSGALMITRSDGVGTRQVSRSGSYVTDLRWSPDARYLIATDDYTGVFTLVDVRTGDALPLAFTRSLRLPTWSR
jgi:Tol biopolymer transport system component